MRIDEFRLLALWYFKLLYSIDTLFAASRHELGEILASTRVAPQGDQNWRRTRIAQALGLNSAQLVGGFGFNPTLEDYATAIHFLGYSSFEALTAERNYTLVHDRCSNLASPASVRLRFDPNCAVLRDIANECVKMLTSNAITQAEFIRSDGLTVREKSRMILQGLLDKKTVDSYTPEIGNSEAAVSLREALAAA